MANQEHLHLLMQGVEVWNKWRYENQEILLDLSGVNLIGVDLRGANLLGADLSGSNLIQADLSEAILTRANLSGSDLSEADLMEAKLIGADLMYANLIGANLSWADLREAKLVKADLREALLVSAFLFEADLRGANLMEADLMYANLIRADLSEADLMYANLSRANLMYADLSNSILRGVNLTMARLVETILKGADLTNSSVYGISAWDLQLDGTIQSDLVITPSDEPVITVDNLEVAQFIYLLLYNEKIRQVIDTITSKVVLILGRFTTERKAVLDAIREELRNHNLLPVLFDFEKPTTRDIHETVTTLARMARFVVADITDPKSIPQELVSIVEQLPSLPIQPILHQGSEPWGMYDHIERYPWVLSIHRYRDLDDLLTSLKDKVIDPAEAKARELQSK